MATKSWTLIDVENGAYVDQLSVAPNDVGGAAKNYAVEKRTLRGGLSDGVDSIHVDNGTCSFVVLPTRGMGLWKAWLGGEEIGWHSPVRGPVHPKFVPLTEPGGLGWLDGFDELMVRCGLESNGAPEFDEQGRLKYPLHGRIGNRPADRVKLHVDGDDGAISVVGQVDETRFHFVKLRMTSTVSTKLGEAALTVKDEVQNMSESPQEIQILYHCNFGTPLLDAGSRFVAPAKTIVPRETNAAQGIKTWDNYQAPEPGFAEQVYFLDLLANDGGDTQVLLKNAHGMRGVGMHFNTRQLPCFTVWKNTTALPDGYVTGLEPGTNYPNPRTFEGERGRVVKLGPQEKVTFEVRLEFYKSATEVESAESAIGKIQSSVKPTIHDSPQKGWCADA